MKKLDPDSFEEWTQQLSLEMHVNLAVLLKGSRYVVEWNQIIATVGTHTSIYIDLFKYCPCPFTHN